MTHSITPEVGLWFTQDSGQTFEIVAIDEDTETVEVQYFDGTVEEYDFDSWYSLEIDSTDAPEDWSGSLDLERDDYGVDLDLHMRPDSSNPLDDLDKHN